MINPLRRLAYEDPPESWEGILIATLAGASTILGGLSLFLVRRFKPIPFAIALGLAGGVMTYVTMVEIIPETIHLCGVGLIEIENEKENPRSEELMTAYGWLLGTSLVFLGWFLGWFISWSLDKCLDRCDLVGDLKFDSDGNPAKGTVGTKRISVIESSDSLASLSASDSDEHEVVLKTSVSLDLVQDRRELDAFVVDGVWDGQAALESLMAREGPFTRFLLKLRGSVDEAEYASMRLANSAFRRDQAKFLRIGIFTAIALGIHNIPEGMATYTSYMEDKNFGFSMALAIAVHNIPEGIAVAVPCYFGTASWIKALGLCSISALSEPLGALIAMGIKTANDSTLTDGILFGFIAGFMLRVSLSELFYTGFKYDPTNIVIVKSMCLGMAIMGYSLAIFEFTG